MRFEALMETVKFSRAISRLNVEFVWDVSENFFFYLIGGCCGKGTVVPVRN
jgi:hypothetical protein